MPYISRDSKGAIISLHHTPPSSDTAEWLEMNDPEVKAFMQQIVSIDQAKQLLVNTDYEMVRIIEDLVDLLVSKRYLNYTELPEAVQNKLGTRRKIRKEMQILTNLIDDGETLI